MSESRNNSLDTLKDWMGDKLDKTKTEILVEVKSVDIRVSGILKECISKEAYSKDIEADRIRKGKVDGRSKRALQIILGILLTSFIYIIIKFNKGT